MELTGKHCILRIYGQYSEIDRTESFFHRLNGSNTVKRFFYSEVRSIIFRRAGYILDGRLEFELSQGFRRFIGISENHVHFIRKKNNEFTKGHELLLTLKNKQNARATYKRLDDKPM